MTEIQNSKNKRYDLEDRTLAYAKRIRDFVKNLPRTISNIEYGKQLIRSSSSVGANYIEANESMGKKDFIFRAKISRKEAKESRYWLNLVEITGKNDEEKECKYLISESTELMNILGSIIRKVEV